MAKQWRRNKRGEKMAKEKNQRNALIIGVRQRNVAA
jgi:hypothetical protein